MRGGVGDGPPPVPPDVGPVQPGDKILSPGTTKAEHFAFMRRIGVRGLPAEDPPE